MTGALGRGQNGPSTTAGSRHAGAKEDDTAPGHNRAQAAGDDAERTAGSAARPAAALPSEAQGQLRQGSDAESGGRPGNVSANAAPRDGREALRDERMPSHGLAQARCRRQTPLTTRTTLFRQKETPLLPTGKWRGARGSTRNVREPLRGVPRSRGTCGLYD